MRIFPVLMAVIVGVALYFAIIDRDTLMALFAPQPDAGGVAETPATQPAPPQDATAESPAPAIDVVVRRSQMQIVDSAVILRGQTEATRQVEVRAETTSTVVSEPLRRGAFVQADQLLCRLDAGTRGAVLDEARARLSEARARRAEAESRIPEAAARLTEAEARLDEALTNQNVAVRLSEDGFAAETRVKNTTAAVAAARASVEAARSGLTAAQSGIQSADATIESAAAAVAQAEKELSRLELRAPFAGYLETDTAELGSLLQSGGLCATVIQLDPMKLVAFAPETEVAKIDVGAPAMARLTSSQDTVAGQVTFLSRSADPTTRTFRVEIEVPNPDLKLRDGQTVEIGVSAEGVSAHLLPASALTLDDDGRLGMRLIDTQGMVSFVPVDIVQDTLQGVWVAGLPEQADVIVRGQEYVRAGVTARATYEQEVSQ